MSTGDAFNEDYFLRGKEAGVSLYSDYTWMPDLTRPMARAIADHLRMSPKDTVLDFGCARGYTVRALREFGYSAYGIDVSRWAIQNCDDAAKPFVNYTDNSPPLLEKEFSWVIAKDVLEHVANMEEVVGILMNAAERGVFVVVPLSTVDGARYVVEEYECDVTHLHRLTLATWASLFVRPGWSVEISYRVRGVKDNYSKYAQGNGFITARRI